MLSQIPGGGNQTPIPNGRMASPVVELITCVSKEIAASPLWKKTASHISHLLGVMKYLAGGSDHNYVTKW